MRRGERGGLTRIFFEEVVSASLQLDVFLNDFGMAAREILIDDANVGGGDALRVEIATADQNMPVGQKFVESGLPNEGGVDLIVNPSVDDLGGLQIEQNDVVGVDADVLKGV